ncbi:hypothetical protein [Tateyamaria omphalii]|nr:hypothetical protein [Tateyamaria omphalii]
MKNLRTAIGKAQSRLTRYIKDNYEALTITLMLATLIATLLL